MNIDPNKLDLIQVVRSILKIRRPEHKMKQHVTTIYWSCADDTDASQAGQLAAERIEQFSPDCKVSDAHTEPVDSNDEDEGES